MKNYKKIITLSMLLGLITNANASAANSELEGAESYVHSSTNSKTAASRRTNNTNYDDSFESFGEEFEEEYSSGSGKSLSEETTVETTEEYFEDQDTYQVVPEVTQAEEYTVVDESPAYVFAGSTNNNKYKLVSPASTSSVEDEEFDFSDFEEEEVLDDDLDEDSFQYATDLETAEARTMTKTYATTPNKQYILVGEAAVSTKVPTFDSTVNTIQNGDDQTIEFIEEDSEPVVRINLRNVGVRFKTNSDRLSYKSNTRIEEIGNLLAKYKNDWSFLNLSGHTDIRGTKNYNRDLAKRRVRTVGKTLLRKGVPVSKVQAKGYAYSRPLDSANNKMAWFKNRRVELKIRGLNRESKLAQSLLKVLKR